MLTRPDFLCIGAKKAGTTWLYDQLQPHPQIWLPPVKELYVIKDVELYQRDIGRFERRQVEVAKQREAGAFSDADSRFLDLYLRKGAGDPDWYVSLFAEAGDRCSGDIDPNVFSHYLRILARMGQVLPRLKLICILRNPVMRSWSHRCMVARQRKIDLTTVPDAENIKTLREPFMSRFSGYRQSLEELQKNFSRERLLFLAFDDLVDRPADLLRQVWDFLEIGAMEIPASAWAKSNAGGAVDMPRAVRDALTEFHRQDWQSALDVLERKADTFVR